MFVSIQTTHCILSLEIIYLKYFHNGLLYMDCIVANNQSFIHANGLVKLKPWMGFNVCDLVSFLRIGSQDFHD